MEFSKDQATHGPTEQHEHHDIPALANTPPKEKEFHYPSSMNIPRFQLQKNYSKMKTSYLKKFMKR